MVPRNFWKAFGPGLVFAGTAIGVSHLVHSTRAGAEYGYALVVFVILANVLKYPFFDFAPRFAQATGTTLLAGYYKLGKKWLVLYLLVTSISMFIVTGAVSFVTTALLANLLHISASWFSSLAIALYAFCIFILVIGSYKALDRIIKVIAIALAASTLLSFFLVLADGATPATELNVLDLLSEKKHWIFIIALMGWMPTAIDMSAWSSIWTVARIQETGYKPSLREALLDFRIGYIATSVLALLFLVLGAEVMFANGEVFSNSAAGFTQQLMKMFTSKLGNWSFYIIAISAFSVMLSTTLTVFDGYARTISESFTLLMSEKKRINYSLCLLVIGIGGLVVVLFFTNQLKVLVDAATILSFLIAPVVAYLNYKLIFSKHTPIDAKPKRGLKVWSILGLIYLSLFTVLFFVVSLS